VDPGCLYRIQDPNFSIRDTRSKRSRIRIKEFSILNPKNCTSAFIKIIRIRIFYYPGSGSRVQGSKKHPIPDPDPQHCFLVSSICLQVAPAPLGVCCQGQHDIICNIICRPCCLIFDYAETPVKCILFIGSFIYSNKHFFRYRTYPRYHR
jgi:hypothetical protein